MRELAVCTQTTPVELAELFNGLLPDDEVGGKPGADGAVVLYVSNQLSKYGQASLQPAGCQAVIAARVAIDVVLQQVDGMPGARPLVGYVREQLAGDNAAKVGWLAPPLTLLAQLYCKTMSAMPDSSAQNRISPRAICPWSDSDDTEQATITLEQRQALETLIDRLMQLPRRSKQPNRH